MCIDHTGHQRFTTHIHSPRVAGDFDLSHGPNTDNSVVSHENSALLNDFLVILHRYDPAADQRHQTLRTI